MGRALAAQAARGGICDGSALGIGSTGRTSGKVAAGVQFNIRPDEAHCVGSRGGLFVLQCVLLTCAIILTQVVDAGVSLRGGAGLDEIGDGDCRQQTNNRHNDHNFHQGEARFARCSDFHTVYSVLCGANVATGGLI